jgi:hypothetical protein
MDLSEVLAELDARITVNRFLLEHLYVGSYQDDPEAFQASMVAAQAALLTRATPAGPMDREALEEVKVRVGVHLERFRRAVALRLGSAQGSDSS